MKNGALRTQSSVRHTSGSAATSSSEQQVPWGTWDWDGRFHPVPRGWRFPRHGVKIVFLEWIYGNHGYRPAIKPLRFLRKNDVSKECMHNITYTNRNTNLNIYPDAVELSRSRGVFSAIEAVARDLKLLDPSVQFSDIPQDAISNVFDPAFTAYLQRIYGDDRQNRLGDISIGTLYNRASKKRKVIDISE